MTVTRALAVGLAIASVVLMLFGALQLRGAQSVKNQGQRDRAQTMLFRAVQALLAAYMLLGASTAVAEMA